MKIVAVIHALMVAVMVYAACATDAVETEQVAVEPEQQIQIAAPVTAEEPETAPVKEQVAYLHSAEFREFWEYHRKLPVKREKILDCNEFRDSDLISLACNIYHESRGETLEGQIAIVNVTLNRVGHDDHPDTVAGVVWEQVRGVPQFSWTKDGRSDIVYNRNAWERSIAVARFAIEGEINDTTEGSLYYHRTGLQNEAVEWFVNNLSYNKDIGRHSFYGI